MPPRLWIPCLVIGLAAGCGGDDATVAPLHDSGVDQTVAPGSDAAAPPGGDGGPQQLPDARADTGAPPTPDGSASDATSDVSPPPDATPALDGSTAVSCSTPGLLFCEDFESYPLGTAHGGKWAPNLNNGTLTIVAKHAGGFQSILAHTNNNGMAALRLSGFAPPNNSFFGRMYAWVAEFPTAPNYAHFTMVEASATSGGTLVRAIGGQYVPPMGTFAGGAVLGVGSDAGPTGDWVNWQTSAPAPAGAWKCFEWEARASDDTVNVWIDGVAKTELTVSRTKHGGSSVDFVFPKFDTIWFGWVVYQGGTTPAQFDTWLDDIVLSTTRIGC